MRQEIDHMLTPGKAGGAGKLEGDPLKLLVRANAESSMTISIVINPEEQMHPLFQKGMREKDRKISVAEIAGMYAGTSRSINYTVAQVRRALRQRVRPRKRVK